MIKFTIQLKRKQTGQNGFLVAQTTVKRHENKNTKQRSTNKKSIKNNRKIKRNRKIKAVGNITPTMDHYPRNGQMGDTNTQSCMPC